MFWDWNRDGKFDGAGFLTDNSGYDTLVESYIAYQDADWKPPGEIDRVTHYYSPPGMVPKNSAPSWVRDPKPTLNELTDDINVNGKPVVKGEGQALIAATINSMWELTVKIITMPTQCHGREFFRNVKKGVVSNEKINVLNNDFFISLFILFCRAAGHGNQGDWELLSDRKGDYLSLKKEIS